MNSVSGIETHSDETFQFERTGVSCLFSSESLPGTNMNRLYTIASLLCLATSVSAQIKQDSVYQVPAIVIDSPEVSVTNTGETPAATIKQDQINATPSQSVGEASKYFPGVLVKDYGGLGGLKTVSVRGLGAEHTAVFWDGIAVSAAQSGQVDLGKTPVVGLKQIKLVKALSSDPLASASAYASPANIELTSALEVDSATLKGTIGLQYGSYDYWQGQVHLLYQVSDNTVVGFNGRFLNVEGNYPYVYANGQEEQQGNRLHNQVYAHALEGNVRSSINEYWDLKAKVFYSKNNTELPGAVVFYNPSSDQSQLTENGFGQVALGYLRDKWQFKYRTKLGHQFLNYKDGFYLNQDGGIDDVYRQNQYFNSIAASYQFVPSSFLYIASDLHWNTLRSNLQEMPSPNRITSLSVVGLKGRHGSFSWNANTLFTHYNEKNENGDLLKRSTPGLAPTIGLKYHIFCSLMLRASYKLAYRIPSFNELYYVRVGNPDLENEKAHLWNGGIVYSKYLEGFLKYASMSADVFYQQIDNKIIAIPTQNLFIWSMQNIGQVESSGVDVSANVTTKSTKVGAFSCTMNYTYQRAIDVSNPAASNYREQIPYVPIESGSTLLQWSCGTVSLGYAAVYSGFRYAMAENTSDNIVNAWAQHDVTLAWKHDWKKVGLTLKGEVLNITDKNYDVIRYYPMPGRQWRIGLFVTI